MKIKRVNLWKLGHIVWQFSNVGSMLGHCLRRWPNIEPTLYNSFTE